MNRGPCGRQVSRVLQGGGLWLPGESQTSLTVPLPPSSPHRCVARTALSFSLAQPAVLTLPLSAMSTSLHLRLSSGLTPAGQRRLGRGERPPSFCDLGLTFFSTSTENIFRSFRGRLVFISQLQEAGVEENLPDCCCREGGKHGLGFLGNAHGRLPKPLLARTASGKDIGNPRIFPLGPVTILYFLNNPVSAV